MYMYIPSSLKLVFNFDRKPHPILLNTVDFCLEMSSNFNYNFALWLKNSVRTWAYQKILMFRHFSYFDSGVYSNPLRVLKCEMQRDSKEYFAFVVNEFS